MGNEKWNEPGDSLNGNHRGWFIGFIPILIPYCAASQKQGCWFPFSQICNFEGDFEDQIPGPVLPALWTPGQRPVERSRFVGTLWSCSLEFAGESQRASDFAQRKPLRSARMCTGLHLLGFGELKHSVKIDCRPVSTKSLFLQSCSSLHMHNGILF